MTEGGEKMTKTIGELNIKVESGTVLNRVRIPEDQKTAVPTKVLTPSAITNGIDLDTLDDITIDMNTIMNRKIKTTHIQDIILKLTTPYDSILINSGYEGLIVPSYFAILREFDLRVINYKYLAFILNSTYGRSRLAAMTTGAANAMLKIKDVLSFPVPMLPREQQEMLGQLYVDFCEKKAALKKYLASEDNMMDAIITDAINKEV